MGTTSKPNSVFVIYQKLHGKWTPFLLLAKVRLDRFQTEQCKWGKHEMGYKRIK
jgi:hypothetical protein